jgi:hypothetical protein
VGVPSAEVHFSVSGGLRVACIDQTGQLSIEVTPAPGRAKVGGTAVLPNPAIRGRLAELERNCLSAAAPRCVASLDRE